MRRRVAWIALALAACLAVGFLGFSWQQARSARAEAIRIAAGEYQRRFGRPAPPYRSLPPGEVGYVDARWQPSRHSYLVGFSHLWLAERESAGQPMPSMSGHTVTEIFRVEPGGSCRYEGTIVGGEY